MGAPRGGLEGEDASSGGETRARGLWLVGRGLGGAPSGCFEPWLPFGARHGARPAPAMRPCPYNAPASCWALGPECFFGDRVLGPGSACTSPSPAWTFPPAVPVHVAAPREPREFPAGTVQEAPESERETAGLGQHGGSPGIPPLFSWRGWGKPTPHTGLDPASLGWGVPKAPGMGRCSLGLVVGFISVSSSSPVLFQPAGLIFGKTAIPGEKKSFMLQQTINMGVIREKQGQKTSTAAGDLNMHPGTSICAPHPGVPGPRDLCCR